MSKREEAFSLLDKMIEDLNEEKKRLGRAVELGQLTNPQRHESYNQFYIKKVYSVADAVLEIKQS